MKSNLYDLSYLDNVSGGKADFYAKILDSFTKSVSEDLVDFEKAMNTKNWLEISELVHRLKSAYEAIGVEILKPESLLMESPSWVDVLDDSAKERLSSRYLFESRKILNNVQESLVKLNVKE